MKYLKLFEEFGAERIVVLRHKFSPSVEISFTVKDGKITDIKKPNNIKFPYEEGQHYNRGIETWCCNNNYFLDKKDTCPEPKLFGIKIKDIPQGHPLRLMYPGKFRK